MDKDSFIKLLSEEIQEFNRVIATEKGDWIVKGFIDISRRIYTISLDTKVVSKVMEILLIPSFEAFAAKYNLALELPPQQNFYPDLTFINKDNGEKYAVDIKSTFKDSANKIKSLTLGAFTGYFRKRDTTKNTTYPYNQYACHLVLGVIYTQVPDNINEKSIYSIDEIDQIESVIKDFIFFVQPKYKIASAIPGSGNTKNIGSITDLDKLIKGEGVFAELGEEVFDDYWMYFLTKDMAKEVEIERPYTNLKTYAEYKKRGIEIIKEHEAEISKLDEGQENGVNSESIENE